MHVIENLWLSNNTNVSYKLSWNIHRGSCCGIVVLALTKLSVAWFCSSIGKLEVYQSLVGSVIKVCIFVSGEGVFISNFMDFVSDYLHVQKAERTVVVIR